MEEFLTILAGIIEWLNVSVLARIPSMISTFESLIAFVRRIFTWFGGLFSR